MTAPTRKFNPGFLNNEELVASYCVRTTEFELLVEVLRECTGCSNPHQIVIGPRGSGKTSLLLRVAAEVGRDAALASRCFPVVFAEESYESRHRRGILAGVSDQPGDSGAAPGGRPRPAPHRR